MSSSTRSAGLFVLFPLALNFLVATIIGSSTNQYRAQNVENSPTNSKQYTVYIINSLPENSHTLHAHCFTKEDDVGFFNLRNSGEHFNWSFLLESGQSKVYYCGFQVLDIEATEVVYTGELVHYCQTKDGYNCVWSVKKDGFYISNSFPPQNFTKIYNADWP